MPPNNMYSNPFGNSMNSSSSNTSQASQVTAQFVSFAPKQTQSPQIRQSKIFASIDKNPKKRTFKGKYDLTAEVPIKYNTVDYFMLVENIRINNENALKDLKRGKASDILSMVMDSLEFLSYIHK